MIKKVLLVCFCLSSFLWLACDSQDGGVTGAGGGGGEGTQDNAHVYGASDSNEFIRRFSVPSGTSETLGITDLLSPYGIAVDGIANRIYWTDYDHGAIFRSNLDGSNREEIISGGMGMPADICIDQASGKIFWCDYGINKVMVANTDGSNVSVLLNSTDHGISGPIGITSDGNGHLYFSDEHTMKIYRVDMDGTNLTELVYFVSDTGAYSPHGIAYNPVDEKIYWVHWVRNTGMLQRCDANLAQAISAGEAETLATNINWGLGVAVDSREGKIYFTGEEGLYTCNLDGSELTFLSTSPHITFIDIHWNS